MKGLKKIYQRYINEDENREEGVLLDEVLEILETAQPMLFKKIIETDGEIMTDDDALQIVWKYYYFNVSFEHDECVKSDFSEIYPDVNQEVIEKYISFSKDDDREYYIAQQELNRETIQFLLNDEPSEDIAETLNSLLAEKSFEEFLAS